MKPIYITLITLTLCFYINYISACTCIIPDPVFSNRISKYSNIFKGRVSDVNPSTAISNLGDNSERPIRFNQISNFIG